MTLTELSKYWAEQICDLWWCGPPARGKIEAADDKIMDYLRYGQVDVYLLWLDYEADMQSCSNPCDLIGVYMEEGNAYNALYAALKTDKMVNGRRHHEDDYRIVRVVLNEEIPE